MRQTPNLFPSPLSNWKPLLHFCWLCLLLLLLCNEARLVNCTLFKTGLQVRASLWYEFFRVYKFLSRTIFHSWHHACGHRSRPIELSSLPSLFANPTLALSQINQTPSHPLEMADTTWLYCIIVRWTQPYLCHQILPPLKTTPLVYQGHKDWQKHRLPSI